MFYSMNVVHRETPEQTNKQGKEQRSGTPGGTVEGNFNLIMILISSFAFVDGRPKGKFAEGLRTALETSSMLVLHALSAAASTSSEEYHWISIDSFSGIKSAP